MTPALPVRLGALQRDVSAFGERLHRTAAAPASPSAGALPPPGAIPSAAVAGLYRQADDLRRRAASISDAIRGSQELRSQPGDLGGVSELLARAHNAPRTVAQRLAVGRSDHAEVTISSTDARSKRSAANWDAARDGRNLPNVRVVGSIPPPAANLVADRLENVPEPVGRILDAQGIRSTLFSGSLTDVWGFRHLRGVRPRGWPAGSTWDHVPGVGTPTGMAANPSRELKGRGHGTDSLALHELGHVVDMGLAREQEQSISESRRWRRGPQREARARSESLGDYSRRYPEEWFAEAFVRYTRTPQTHAALARWYPESYRLLKRELGAPRFD